MSGNKFSTFTAVAKGDNVLFTWSFDTEIPTDNIETFRISYRKPSLSNSTINNDWEDIDLDNRYALENKKYSLKGLLQSNTIYDFIATCSYTSGGSHNVISSDIVQTTTQSLPTGFTISNAAADVLEMVLFSNEHTDPLIRITFSGPVTSTSYDELLFVMVYDGGSNNGTDDATTLDTIQRRPSWAEVLAYNNITSTVPNSLLVNLRGDGYESNKAYTIYGFGCNGGYFGPVSDSVNITFLDLVSQPSVPVEIESNDSTGIYNLRTDIDFLGVDIKNDPTKPQSLTYRLVVLNSATDLTDVDTYYEYSLDSTELALALSTTKVGGVYRHRFNDIMAFIKYGSTSAENPNGEKLLNFGQSYYLTFLAANNTGKFTAVNASLVYYFSSYKAAAPLVLEPALVYPGEKKIQVRWADPKFNDGIELIGEGAFDKYVITVTHPTDSSKSFTKDSLDFDSFYDISDSRIELGTIYGITGQIKLKPTSENATLPTTSDPSNSVEATCYTTPIAPVASLDTVYGGFNKIKVTWNLPIFSNYNTLIPSNSFANYVVTVNANTTSGALLYGPATITNLSTNFLDIDDSRLAFGTKLCVTVKVTGRTSNEIPTGATNSYALTSLASNIVQAICYETPAAFAPTLTSVLAGAHTIKVSWNSAITFLGGNLIPSDIFDNYIVIIKNPDGTTLLTTDTTVYQSLLLLGTNYLEITNTDLLFGNTYTVTVQSRINPFKFNNVSNTPGVNLTSATSTPLNVICYNTPANIIESIGEVTEGQRTIRVRWERPKFTGTNILIPQSIFFTYIVTVFNPDGTPFLSTEDVDKQFTSSPSLTSLTSVDTLALDITTVDNGIQFGDRYTVEVQATIDPSQINTGVSNTSGYDLTTLASPTTTVPVMCYSNPADVDESIGTVADGSKTIIVNWLAPTFSDNDVIQEAIFIKYIVNVRDPLSNNDIIYTTDNYSSLYTTLTSLNTRTVSITDNALVFGNTYNVEVLARINVSTGSTSQLVQTQNSNSVPVTFYTTPKALDTTISTIAAGDLNFTVNWNAPKFSDDTPVPSNLFNRYIITLTDSVSRNVIYTENVINFNTRSLLIIDSDIVYGRTFDVNVQVEIKNINISQTTYLTSANSIKQATCYTAPKALFAKLTAVTPDAKQFTVDWSADANVDAAPKFSDNTTIPPNLFHQYIITVRNFSDTSTILTRYVSTYDTRTLTISDNLLSFGTTFKVHVKVETININVSQTTYLTSAPSNSVAVTCYQTPAAPSDFSISYATADVNRQAKLNWSPYSNSNYAGLTFVGYCIDNTSTENDEFDETTTNSNLGTQTTNTFTVPDLNNLTTYSFRIRGKFITSPQSDLSPAVTVYSDYTGIKQIVPWITGNNPILHVTKIGKNTAEGNFEYDNLLATDYLSSRAVQNLGSVVYTDLTFKATVAPQTTYRNVKLMVTYTNPNSQFGLTLPTIILYSTPDQTVTTSEFAAAVETITSDDVGNKSCNLEWTPPATSTTSYSITSFKVGIKVAGASSYTIIDTVPYVVDTALYTYTINTTNFSTFQNGQEYTVNVFTVHPENDVIVESPSNEVYFKAYTSASAPTNFAVSAGDKQAIVTFGLPADNGGFPIINYKIEYYKVDGNGTKIIDSDQSYTTATNSVSPVTIIDLENDSTYKFQMYARTEETYYTPTTTDDILSGAPTNTIDVTPTFASLAPVSNFSSSSPGTVNNTSGVINFAWSQYILDQSTHSGYSFTYTITQVDEFGDVIEDGISIANISSTATTYTLNNGLTLGTLYYFRIAVVLTGYGTRQSEDAYALTNARPYQLNPSLPENFLTSVFGINNGFTYAFNNSTAMLGGSTVESFTILGRVSTSTSSYTALADPVTYGVGDSYTGDLDLAYLNLGDQNGIRYSLKIIANLRYYSNSADVSGTSLQSNASNIIESTPFRRALLENENPEISTDLNTQQNIITWSNLSPAINFGSPIIKYNIYRGINASAPISYEFVDSKPYIVESYSYTDNTAIKGTLYAYQIKTCVRDLNSTDPDAVLEGIESNSVEKIAFSQNSSPIIVECTSKDESSIAVDISNLYPTLNTGLDSGSEVLVITGTAPGTDRANDLKVNIKIADIISWVTDEVDDHSVSDNKYNIYPANIDNYAFLFEFSSTNSKFTIELASNPGTAVFTVESTDPRLVITNALVQTGVTYTFTSILQFNNPNENISQSTLAKINSINSNAVLYYAYGNPSFLAQVAPIGKTTAASSSSTSVLFDLLYANLAGAILNNYAFEFTPTQASGAPLTGATVVTQEVEEDDMNNYDQGIGTYLFDQLLPETTYKIVLTSSTKDYYGLNPKYSTQSQTFIINEAAPPTFSINPTHSRIGGVGNFFINAIVQSGIASVIGYQLSILHTDGSFSHISSTDLLGRSPTLQINTGSVLTISKFVLTINTTAGNLEYKSM
jgi:hypothetical protein